MSKKGNVVLHATECGGLAFAVHQYQCSLHGQHKCTLSLFVLLEQRKHDSELQLCVFILFILLKYAKAEEI